MEAERKRPAPLDERPTALYRFYDADGDLLYLGITHDLKIRWTTHRLQQAWWHLVARKTVEWHDDRASALEAEAVATKAERPRFDKTLFESPRTRYEDPRRDEIATLLRAEIEAEAYRQGKRLPFPTVLAEKYGTSPATVGSLYLNLLLRGVIEGHGGRYWLRGCKPTR